MSIKLTDDMNLEEAGDNFADNPSLQTAVQYLYTCMALYERGLCVDHTMLNVVHDVVDFLEEKYQ